MNGSIDFEGMLKRKEQKLERALNTSDIDENEDLKNFFEESQRRGYLSSDAQLKDIVEWYAAVLKDNIDHLKSMIIHNNLAVKDS